ncbi:energy transducer TonB [Steroidobacter flavus]|uniref:Energy transducer TonB n=1 Tax=Steroidobacter flavus TaxID=1842136 RepID=A0ABV8SP34_9GAMM
MTATTVNSFPSLNNWNSPRAWALAIIVLLHMGFFWALTHGLSINPLTILKTAPPLLIPITEKPTPPPPKPLTPVDVNPVQRVDTLPPTPLDFPTERTITDPIIDDVPKIGNEIVGPGSATEPLPKIVEPRIDSRRGLSEPYYSPADIRAGNEGTVVLSIYILADGRVGDVKLVSSSGHEGLDKSAMREAKKWRFVPGTTDGQPMAMWKQLPITFRLNTRM